MNQFFKKLTLLVVLVRRDYTLQFAGTAAGVAWLVIQYLFQIGIFYVIFGLVLPDGNGRAAGGSYDYFSYLLSGMILWLPLSESMIRSCAILDDNRPLIKRTRLGMELFQWIPIMRGIVQYLVLYIPVVVIIYFRGELALSSPAALLFGIASMILLAGWNFILSRLSILLKDLTSVMRLATQLLFWATPVVYTIPERWVPIFRWNPIYAILRFHRFLLIRNEPPLSGGEWVGLLLFAFFSAAAYTISARRLNIVVADNL